MLFTSVRSQLSDATLAPTDRFIESTSIRRGRTHPRREAPARPRLATVTADAAHQTEATLARPHRSFQRDGSTRRPPLLRAPPFWTTIRTRSTERPDSVRTESARSPQTSVPDSHSKSAFPQVRRHFPSLSMDGRSGENRPRPTGQPIRFTTRDLRKHRPGRVTVALLWTLLEGPTLPVAYCGRDSLPKRWPAPERRGRRRRWRGSGRPRRPSAGR
jgi:hypothetical protein